jgi:glyoxylase I family protein
MEIQYLCPMLEVFDMDKSIAFYVDILGFKVHQSAGEKDDIGWVWLNRGDLNLMLNTQYEKHDRPARPDAMRVAAHHDTTLYFGCPEVDVAYNELKQKGLTLSPPELASYGMKQLYLRDPDGYNICFQWPT